MGLDKWRLFYEASRDPGKQRDQRSETFRGTVVEAHKRLRALISSVDKGGGASPIKRLYPNSWSDGCAIMRRLVTAPGPSRDTSTFLTGTLRQPSARLP